MAASTCRSRLLLLLGLASCGGSGVQGSAPLAMAPVAAAAAPVLVTDPPSRPDAPVSAPAVADPAPGWLGVALSARSPDEAGAVVSNVLRRSPADTQGLQVGDIVLGINAEPVSDPEQLSQAIAALGAGGRANLIVQRGADKRLLAVELGHNPGLEGQLRLGFVGAPAPELSGVEVAQGDAGPTLQGLRGRVVVLEFWATWCAACRALQPTLNDWHDRYPALQAQIVSVTIDSAVQASRDAAQLGLRYSVLSDPQGQTARLYQAFALPTLFVIDRAGVVREVSVGYDPARLRALEATVERLIAEPG
jgi:thiol-disulfide isomerase/thioredoxin